LLVVATAALIVSAVLSAIVGNRTSSTDVSLFAALTVTIALILLTLPAQDSRPHDDEW
jgi:hypothetical protein